MDDIYVAITAVLLIAGIVLSVWFKRSEWFLLALYLIFLMAVIDTMSTSSLWVTVIGVIIVTIAFYGAYVAMKWIDRKIADWRSRR